MLQRTRKNAASQSLADETEDKGCSLSKHWNPEVIGSTATLPVAVKTSLWNCMAGNTVNLLHVLGQYTDDISRAMKLLQTNFSPTLSTTKFKTLKELMRKFHYLILNTPEEMDFVALSTLMRNACLPMLVSLRLESGNNSYEHVIGICPNKPDDGGETQFLIIDGAHPQLKAIEFSLDNLNWCCGGTNGFTVVSEGFLLCPSPRLTKRIVALWSSKYKTKEDIKRAGLCVCLGVGKVKIPDYMRNLNVVCRTTEEAKEIAKRAIGVQKNL